MLIEKMILFRGGNYKMIIFFNPFVFMVIILLIIVGGASSILSNISTIILMGAMLCMLFYGVYLMFSFGDGKSFLGMIARILQGFLYVTATYYTMVLIELGTGTARYVKAKFPLLDLLHIRNWDENFIYLFLSLVIISIVSASISLARWFFIKRKILSAIFYGITIVIIASFYIGGMKMAIRDSYVNSYDDFDFDLEGYEVLQDTNIYIKVDPILTKPKLLKTGVLKAGSKLYSNRKSTEKNNVVYYQVCDKNREIGFVSEKDVKVLYEIGYALSEDSPLYGIRKEYWNAPTNTGEYFTVCSMYKTDEIIGNVLAGTVVDRGGLVENSVTGKKDYWEITLPDGNEGAVPSESIEEIKIPIS